MTWIARCCCQACELTAEGEPVLNAVCHCDNCKRRTGTAFGWSAYFPDEAVTIRGELTRYEVTTVPGERFFCARCGATLYWRSLMGFMPGCTGVAGGCFTETPLPDPAFSATDARRCTWVSLPAQWPATP